MNLRSKNWILFLLIVFIVGWGTQTLSLFDVGRYSFPLILFAGLPFCVRMTYRSTSFLFLPIASTVFAVLVGLFQGADSSHILSQAVLQALAITFAAGIASIDWHTHMDMLQKALVAMGIPIVAYACYQMVARVAHLPGAFLPVTNKQYYIDGGLQRDWDKVEVTRASSIFSEPSELGYFCLWLFVIGLSTNNRTIRILSLLLASAGILFSQSLAAVLGVAVIALGYCFLHGVTRQLLGQIVMVTVVSVAVVLAIKPIAPDAFEHFSSRITEAASLDERADSGRVDHLPACIELIKASPVWGYGISSLAAADSTGSDVTTINYVMVLMERGLVGAVLFFIPWFAIALRAWALPHRAQGKTFAFLILVMTLYAFCFFSITYFLPFWLALGVSASLVLHTYSAGQRRSKSQQFQRSPQYLSV